MPSGTQQIGIKKRAFTLSEIYQDGLLIRERIRRGTSDEGLGKSRNAVIRDLVTETKLNPAELWMRVAFVDKYDETSLAELLQWRHLSWTHVRKLLTLSDAKERRNFARQANECAWSPQMLACEIEADLGVKHPGSGRPLTPRRCTPGTLYSLKKQVKQLLHVFDVFNCEVDCSAISKAIVIQRNVRAAMIELRALSVAVPEFMKRLEQIRAPLPDETDFE